MQVAKSVRRTVPIVGSVAGVVVAVGAMPVQSVQGGAEAWARSLDGESARRFSNADALASLPREYRRALGKNARTPEAQAAFWQGVFKKFRADRILTAPQSEAVGYAESLLTAANFSRTVDIELFRSRIEAARMKIVEVLGEESATELFRSAGPATDVASGLPMSERISYMWRMHRPSSLVAIANFIVPGLAAVDCNCADDGDCYYQQTCHSPMSCTANDPWPPFGCGDWNAHECTRLCSYDVPPL